MELNKENLYQKYIIENKTMDECQEIFNIPKNKLRWIAKKNNYKKLKRKDAYTFSDEIIKNMGEDYELISPYVNGNTEVNILHKKCKNILSFQPYRIKIDGKYRKCPYCRKEEKKRITDEEFEKLYKQGVGAKEVSEKYHICETTYYRKVKKLKIKRTKEEQEIFQKKVSERKSAAKIKYDIDKQIVINMLKDGVTQEEIAKKTGYSRSGIYFYIKRNNLTQYRNIEKIKIGKEVKLRNNLKKKYGVENVMFVEDFRKKAILNKPDIHISKPEIGLKAYIESIYDGEVTRLNDGQYELDIYIPDKKIGIEYNGTYWHSTLQKSKNYHFDKSKHFEEKGIRVIHIWEYEWNNERQRPILENIIKNALGVNKNRIYARKCSVEVRESVKMKPFFEKNNIQGFRGGKFAICLVYEGKIVMSYMFGHCYFGKGKYDWEVIRGATELGYTVVGGASKIWKYFIDNYKPRNCVYYIDYNYFNGNSIPNLGLKYITSQASFKNWWIKDGIVKNREPKRHKEIKELYEKGEVVPIYNAGTKVYAWENQNYKLGN